MASFHATTHKVDDNAPTYVNLPAIHVLIAQQALALIHANMFLP
jgi:hypothetical protein